MPLCSLCHKDMSNTIIIDKDIKWCECCYDEMKKSVRVKLDSNLKDKVWRKHTNTLDWHCYICKCPIQYNKCHMAHIVPSCQGGKNTIDNVVPTCQLCNLSMGKQNLNEYKQAYESFINPQTDQHDNKINDDDIKTDFVMIRNKQVFEMMNTLILTNSYFQHKDKFWPLCQVQNYQKILKKLEKQQHLYDDWINIFSERGVVIWMHNPQTKHYYPTDLDYTYACFNKFMSRYTATFAT